MDAESPKGYTGEGSGSEPTDDAYEMRSLSQLGGTEADEYEMRMLGRIQQLNVWISPASP